jgi:hypothetical protein
MQFWDLIHNENIACIYTVLWVDIKCMPGAGLVLPCLRI